MISMRLVAAAFATLFLAAPMLASASDIQIRVNFGLVFQDEQSGSDPSSSADFDFGTGRATGFARFGLSAALPLAHETAAEIILDSTTVDVIAVQTFADKNQQWNFSDTDLGRFGSIQLQAKFNLDWNLEVNASTPVSTNSFLSYDKFDAGSNFQLGIGFFSCSSSGGTPSCSGAGFDQSELIVNFNGTSYDITGPVYLLFTDGMVNSDDNWFGMSTGTSVSMDGGLAGDFIRFGAGNLVGLELTSPEASVTVVPVPEPALASLQTLALIVVVAIRRRRHRAL